MIKYWQEFGKKVESGSVRTLFEQIKPQLQGFSIVLTVSSEVQKELMKDEVPKFMGILQKKTGIRHYSIDWLINKQPVDEQQKNLPAYLPNEQLKEMIAANPKLNDLIKRLQLHLN